MYIYEIEIVKGSDKESFLDEVMKKVEDFQNSDFEVEIQYSFSMSGMFTEYTAMIIAEN